LKIIASTRLYQAEWLMLYNKLAKDYPHSVLLIRSKCKNTLGFLPRTHTEWFDSESNSCIMLDWYNETKKTFFLIKYAEYLATAQLDKA